MVSQMRRFFFLPLLVYGLQNIIFVNVALSQSAQPAADAQSPQAVFLKSTDEQKKFASDGKPIVFEDLGLQLFPVAGWDVTTGGVMTAIMQEPEKEENGKIDYSQPKFQRNITISTIHKSLPLDEQRAKEITEKLSDRFSKDPLVQNFRILEHKFVDQRAKNDALLIYSSMTLGKYDMMQMHLVIGAAEKQYLLTYTDFAKDFNDQNPVFTKAWESMFSTVPTGMAPKRYAELMKNGPIAGGVLLVLFIGFMMHRMSSVRHLKRMSDDMSRDEYHGDDEEGALHTATSAVWNLSSTQTHQSRSLHTMGEAPVSKHSRHSQASNSMFSTF